MFFAKKIVRATNGIVDLVTTTGSRISVGDGVLPELLLDHTTCSLGRLGQILLRVIERRLERLGLRARHVGVLMALRDHGALSQQELGALLRIDPATMVATLNDLEARKLVRREPDARDRRRHAVKLSTAGTRTLDEAEEVLDCVEDDVLVLLPPRQQRALDQAIRILAQSQELADFARSDADQS